MTMVVETNGNGPLDRQAAVLSSIQQMHEDFQAAREEIAELKAELHREVDRRVLLNEEREYYRTIALRLQREKTELATDLSNIGLLCVRAQESLKNAEEIEVVEEKK